MASDRAYQERLGRVRLLLDWWSVIHDPGSASFGASSGDGSGVALMPLLASHPSVRELDRVLKVLWVEEPSTFMHLKAYRCGVEWRTVVRRRRRRRARGKGFEVVDVPVRERVVPRWVSLERVARGERFLADRFRGEVVLPRDLRDLEVAA